MKIGLSITMGAALVLGACATVQGGEAASAEPAATPDTETETMALMAPRCDDGQPHPNAPAELEQFAFLIGDYSIALHQWQGEEWCPARAGPPARWNGWYGLGGMAIYDEWYLVDPGVDPQASRGVNVRLYDEEAGEWDMMWVANSNYQVQDLRAEMVDGVLTMWQVYPERPDFLAEFHIEDADHWARISYTKDEAGEWVNHYKLAATRIACGA